MKTSKKSIQEEQESLAIQLDELNSYLAKDHEGLSDEQRALLVQEAALKSQLINLLAERIAKF